MPISVKHWENIVMNFITDLLKSEGKNVILIIINHLSKGRHYVSCFINNNGIFVKWTVKIMIQNVFQLHELSVSIVLDHRS